MNSQQPPHYDEPTSKTALALSAAVHAVLVAALFFGAQWKNEQPGGAPVDVYFGNPAASPPPLRPAPEPEPIEAKPAEEPVETKLAAAKRELTEEVTKLARSGPEGRARAKKALIGAGVERVSEVKTLTVAKAVLAALAEGDEADDLA